jgi:fumarate reductase flavoprotein subunit
MQESSPHGVEEEPIEMAKTGDVADVVVVGGGGAGLAAAVSAAQQGARVVLLEKQDEVGGSTILSVGSFSASGSRFQIRERIHDRAEEYAEDMVKFAPGLPGVVLEGDAPEMRLLLARESAETLHWLESLGVAFVGPYLEPPHRVARMHNVIPNSRGYVARLFKAARKLRVTVVTGAVDTELVAEDGRVVGVKVTVGGGRREYRARGGVVLAAGDFSGNPEMRREFLPPDAAAAAPINPYASGDGQRLGMGLGAATKGMDVTFGPQLRFPEPPKPGLLSRLPTWGWLCRVEAAIVQRVPTSWLKPVVKSLLITWMSPAPDMFEQGTILVNREGNRFCDERVETGSLAFQPDGKGFLVLDSRIAAYFNVAPHAISTAPGIAFAQFDDYQRGRPDLVHEALDAESLAAQIGVDPENLAKAVADRGYEPPLYAMGPLYSTLTVTEGGLCVDEKMRVLREDGEVIPGLYGAGGMAQSGMLLKGHGHHIAWVMSSGRLAGRDAARQAMAVR